MGDRAAKNALFDGFAEVAKALSTGRRAELIDVLAQGERHVEDLAEAIAQSTANTSFHLRALAAAGLVSTRREGTHVYYRLASARVEELWASVRDVATAHHQAIDELSAAYLGDRGSLDQITRDELARRLDGGDIVVIDVRPRPEYAAGHIAGARSIPIDDLAQQVRSLPDGVEIVAYCRGPFCVFADDAVRLLKTRGRRARRLEDGYPEWHKARHPVTAVSSAQEK